MDECEVTRPSRKPSGQSEAEKRMSMRMEKEETRGNDASESEEDGRGNETMNFPMTRQHIAACRKSWFYDAGDPLTCIATSRFFPLIAIAGRNLLQVLRVDGDNFVSVHRLTNLQRNISSTTTVNTSRPGTSSVVSSTATSATTAAHFQPPRSYAINDLAWSDSKSILATCSNAGDLIIWDLSRGVTPCVCFVGHSRSVHRIHFNPNAGNEIISASHDGTVKLFDTRDQSCRQTFHVRMTAPSPVRDVAYCPHEGHTLAGAFENGLVCIWDTRNENRPARCFQAHNAVAGSIDWHPLWNSSNRNWLATAGGRDNTVKVWDLNNTSPTAVYSLRAKNPGHVRWRVGETYQLISSCSMSLDLSIHLWELNRPYIPYITFEGHSHTISGIAWSTEPNAFYSVARDAMVVRHYVGDGLQTVRGANAVALAFNCRGPLAHAVGGEPGQRVLDGRSGNHSSMPTTTRNQHLPLAQRVLSPSVAEATATRTPHQLLVTRRYLFPMSSLPPLDNRKEDVSLMAGEVPSNIIPPEVFVAQSQSELFVADFILKKSTELEAPLSFLLLPDAFIYMAKNYRISGSSVAEVCDHNAAVARHVNKDFLAHFWLTLKMFLGNAWVSPSSSSSSSPPPPATPSKLSTEMPPIPRINEISKEPELRPHCAPPIQRTLTYAEVANRRSNGVCVLDFISRINASEERKEKEAFAETAVLKSEAPPIDVVGVASAATTVLAVSAPPSLPLSSHHHNHHHQRPSSAPETGSICHSVNYLFTDDNSVDPNASTGCNGRLLSDSTAIRTAPLQNVSLLPSEENLYFEQAAAAAAAAAIPWTAEEEQKLQQPSNARKISPPEADYKPEVESLTEEAFFTNMRSRGSRNPPPLSNMHHFPARLDLTSVTTCVDTVDPGVVASLTRPLDFTHRLGAWLLELIEVGHTQSVCTALLIFGTERTRINAWASEKQIETWFYAYLDLLVRFRLWSVSTQIIKHCGNIQGVVPFSAIAEGSIATTTTATNAPSVGSAVAPPVASESGQQQLHLPKQRFSSAEKSPSIALPLARHIAILNQTGTSVSVRCGKCSKLLHRSATLDTVSAAAPPDVSTPAATASHAAWACSRHRSAETALSTCAVCHMTVRGIYLWCVGCSHGGHLDHIREWISRRAECPAGCGHYCEYGKLDGNLHLQISA